MSEQVKTEDTDCFICYTPANAENDAKCDTCVGIYHPKCLNDWFDKSEELKCCYCKQQFNEFNDLSDFQYAHNLLEIDLKKNPMLFRYLKKQTKKMWLNAVAFDPSALKYIKYQTKKVCRVALKKDPTSIQYIRNQTPDLCRFAIINSSRFSSILQYIREESRTPEICKLALRHDGNNIMYIENQTLEYCQLAINQRPTAIYCIKNTTNEMWEFAVALDYNLFKFSPFQSEKMCLRAVRRKGILVMFVKEQTEEICLEAIRQNPEAFKYIKEKTEKICLETMKYNGKLLAYVPNKTDDICWEALNQSGWALKYIDNQTTEMCLKAIETDPRILLHVKKQTFDICLKAALYHENLDYYLFWHEFRDKVAEELRRLRV